MTTRTSKHSKVKSQSKTAFVLALPATLSVGEVVKKAKTAGIALSPNYVSNIRSSAKAAAKQKGSRLRSAEAGGRRARPEFGRVRTSGSVRLILAAAASPAGLFM
jgi:hypothetical protein